jgi:hypothetical protein
VNQVGGNELWKNLGRGKFKNITEEAEVGLPGRISVGAAFADVSAKSKRSIASRSIGLLGVNKL